MHISSKILGLYSISVTLYILSVLTVFTSCRGEEVIYPTIGTHVTDEVRALPLGGVIPIEIDVNDFPPEGGSIGGGGFNALVGDWDEKTGSTTILN